MDSMDRKTTGLSGNSIDSLLGRAVDGTDETTVKKRLSATQKKCAELLIMKDISNMSNNDIADQCGIDRATLYRWKQKKEFNDYLNDLADEFNRSFLSDAYSELRKILVYGKNHEKLKAVELILKGQGKLKDVQETRATVQAELSVEDMLKSLGV